MITVNNKTNTTMNNFTLYVPSVRKDGNPIENRKQWLEGIIKDVCKLTGGCTATNGQGSYVMGTGELVTEKVTLLNSFGDVEITEITKIAKNIKNGGFQESVLFTFNNKPYFI